MLLTDKELRNRICNLSRDKRCHIAVAFWGTGSDELLVPAGTSARVICNLKMGGTNPDAIEKVMHAIGEDNVRQHDFLHAKVYVGNDNAIIASANASANGLGLEGREQESWIEAGVEVLADEPAAWFDKLWRQSQRITPKDLKLAREAWRSRRAQKPPLRSFADFEVRGSDFPLLYWHGDDDWDGNKNADIAVAGPPTVSLEELIEDAVDIRGDDDRAELYSGRWVLHWKRRKDNGPNNGVGLVWHVVGGIIEKAFRYKGTKEWLACTFPLAKAPAPPFDANERKFKDLFFGLLESPQFEILRSEHKPAGFFRPEVVQATQRFWGELKRQYGEAK